jgi:hypothetical protein
MASFSEAVYVGLAVAGIWIFMRGGDSNGTDRGAWGGDTEAERAALDAEDLTQMLEARNARRRARGQAEVSLEDYEQQVMADIRTQQRKDQEYLAAQLARSEAKEEADREIEEMLEATNRRRRARGLPERTRADVEREFGGG